MANPCPAVVTLDNLLKNSFPFLRESFKDATGPSMRTQIMTSGYQRHTTGLALDIFLFAQEWYRDKSIDWKNEEKLGSNLVKLFVEQQASMKWTEMIYKKRLFRAPYSFTPWKEDDRHFTHIHIDWMANGLKGSGKEIDFIAENSPLGKTTDFAPKLSARLAQLKDQWENKTLNAIDLDTIYPTYAADIDPVGTWQVRSEPWYGTYIIEANKRVRWSDSNNKSGTGTWQMIGNKIDFVWEKSKTTESWTLPIMRSKITGAATMAGKKYSVEATKNA